jgi:hypothetical protein
LDIERTDLAQSEFDSHVEDIDWSAYEYEDMACGVEDPETCEIWRAGLKTLRLVSLASSL